MLRQLTHSKSLLLLREAFTSLLPIVLILSIVVLLSGLTGILESWGIIGASVLNGAEVSRLYYFLIPLFLNLALSMLLAKTKSLDPIGTMLIAMVCFFRLSGFLSINSSAQITSYNSSILTSIPATFLAAGMLAFFTRLPYLKLVKQQTDLNPQLKKTLNLLIPGLLTVLCFELLGQCLQLIAETGLVTFIARSLPKFQQISEVQELILYKTVSLLTWFIGLHGEHSADGLFRLLKNTPAGDASGLGLKTFHDVFMNIGGSGCTFVVPFLILLTQKPTQFKSIAQLSLPFSLFNVNEILLFGLPIILNPFFLIPFFLAPFVNMVVALVAMTSGAFTIAPVEISWMSPPLYSAYIATHGSGWAVFTNFVCLLVDGCIYYPFLVLAEHQFKTPLYLSNLFEDDAYGFINEEINLREERLFVSKQMGKLRSMTSARRVLKELKGRQLLLYFQPKVEARSGHLMGIEALIRSRDAMGRTLPPNFLPVLYQQGISKVIDQKVVDLIFEQIQQWRAEGLSIPPISINFDKDFLLDQSAVRNFIALAKEYDIYFCLEITEHTYTVEVTALASVVRQLRAAGHRISIDDFGAGYSSLTSLVSLEADEIKLDRKLVDPPQEAIVQGQILLESSVRLCHDLGFSVVAEGVENLSQLQLVRDCGVDVIQGNYTGKPMHADQVSLLFTHIDNCQEESSFL
ncbi:MAG: EAL domain-containing protein [Cyanobacteria bacterium P01_A01_bin.17]